MKKYREVIAYLIVGGLTTAVSLGVYWICVSTVFDPKSGLLLQCANVISWLAAVTFAYYTNRNYVFESKNKAIGKEAAAFFGARISTLFLDMACMFLMVTAGQMNDKLAKLIVQVIVTVVNYVMSKFLVFHKE